MPSLLLLAVVWFWVSLGNTLEIVVGGVLLQFLTGLARETATPILWALAGKPKGRVPEDGAPSRRVTT